MSTLYLVASAAGETTEHAPAVSPYAIGAITLVILLALLLGLVWFGGGREHS